MRTRIHGVRVFDGRQAAGVRDVVVEDDLVVAVSAPGRPRTPTSRSTVGAGPWCRG